MILYAFLISIMSDAQPTHIILIYVLTIIILFSEEYKFEAHHAIFFNLLLISPLRFLSNVYQGNFPGG
jgi:hypothetical protein